MMKKTRTEAQISADSEIEEFRPMSFATMSILEKFENKTLALILNPNTKGIVADTEDLITFMFVHWRRHDLKIMRRQLFDTDAFMDRVYEWAETVQPEVIAKGISYFLGIKEDVKLNSVESIPDPGKKKGEKSKNSHSQQ